MKKAKARIHSLERAHSLSPDTEIVRELMRERDTLKTDKDQLVTDLKKVSLLMLDEKNLIILLDPLQGLVDLWVMGIYGDLFGMVHL